MSEYRGGHQPFDDGPSLDDMTPMFGEDVYAHPEWYVFSGRESFERESVRVFLSVRGRPDAPVRIFRAVPAGVKTIHRGDWVALSADYARQHAMQSDNPADDWPVIAATVPARTVHTGGSDLIEWGYFGPDVDAT